MAISNLTQLTAAQYNALTIIPFSSTVNSTRSGNPDGRISINLAGVVGASQIAFTIADQASADSALSIASANSNTLTAEVTNGGSPMPTTTFWTIDMGENPNEAAWTLNVGVNDKSKPTGTWIFVKGKSIDDKY